MNLNKNSSYVLIHILNGNDTAKKISEQMQSIDVRSIQRALTRLTDLGLLARIGTNHPNYRVNYDKLFDLRITDKLLEDENRPKSLFNHGLIDWLLKLPANELGSLLRSNTNDSLDSKHPEQMTVKELEYLTIELSWKSSALEGNTYTLLDTQLLLLEGIKAKNRTEFETQMILNHKDAVAFIIENKDLFGSNDIKFRTIEELHRIIGNNLGIASGIRKQLVRITASNYEPLSNPHQLRENADNILEIINNTPNPYIKALLALALIPYLQIFEDGNKRTGRMLANAILINLTNRGFSLRKTDARRLAIAYLAFYEFNSIRALSKILEVELKTN